MLTMRMHEKRQICHEDESPAKVKGSKPQNKKSTGYDIPGSGQWLFGGEPDPIVRKVHRRRSPTLESQLRKTVETQDWGERRGVGGGDVTLTGGPRRALPNSDVL